jgi:hypothetical protein
METNDIIQRFTDLRNSPKITGAEEWMHIASDFQLLHWELGSQELAAKIKANKKFKEIRPQEKTKADAEIIWQASEEWSAWKELERTLENIEDFMKIAKKQADIRKANTY